METKYFSTAQAASKLGLTRTRVKKLASQGRIRGCMKIGKQWVFPLPVKILPPQK